MSGPVKAEQPRLVNTLEVRRAANGYVVSAFFTYGHFVGDAVVGKGYETHVVESHTPEDVGNAVRRILEHITMATDTVIPPARPVA